MLSNERGAFVFFNIAVNLLFLVRAYVTMRSLDYSGLGLITLLQSIILLISAFQFGILNGGYRLLCAAEGDSAQRINNLIYSYAALLTCAGTACTLAVLASGQSYAYTLTVALGVLAGILTLIRNWMSSQMIALVMLGKLNRIGLWSALASMVPLIFVQWHPLLMCAASLVLQPAVFAAAVLITERPLRPTGFAMPAGLLKQVLHSGFIVFLTGIFLHVNTQLERWYVLSHIGLPALGHLYLAFLFINLFQILPSSLDAIYLPKLVQAHNAKNATGVARDMRRFFLLIAAYCAATVAAVCLIAPPLLSWLLPDHAADLRYVYLVLPGLVLLTLASPFAITFNVLIRYRFYFLAYGAGTALTTAMLLGSSVLSQALGLDGVSWLRSATGALTAAILMGGYITLRRDHAGFRFALFAPRSGGTGHG